MKTTATHTVKFPKVAQMALYLTLLAAFAFLNCLVMKAAEPEKKSEIVTTAALNEAIEEETEADIKLEAWMLNFDEE